MDLHGARVRDVLPRLGGSELGVPDASEIFPMETRALAIAFFFAIGTAVGGITGPLLFGQMIESGDPGQVTIAFLIGSAVMALGGIVAAFLAVRAEQTPLETVAQPLTAAEAESGDLEATGERAEERREPEREPEDLDAVGAAQEADWERRYREREQRRLSARAVGSVTVSARAAAASTRPGCWEHRSEAARPRRRRSTARST